MGKALGKSTEKVLATSKRQPFLGTGERGLKRALTQLAALDDKVDAMKIKEHLTQALTQWGLNTVLENTSNMFSGDAADIEDMIRSMKNGGAPPRRPPPPPPRRSPPPPPPPKQPAADSPAAADDDPAPDEHLEL